MTGIPRGVLVAVRSGEACWTVHHEGRADPRTYAVEAPDDQAMAELAQLLVDRHGGVAVRSVVFIDAKCGAAEPLRLRAYPQPVHVITPGLALGYATSSEAQRFLVVDAAEPIAASLVFRTRAGLYEQPLERPDAALLRDTAASMGIRHVAVLPSPAPSRAMGGLPDVLPSRCTLEILSQDAHLAGAASFGAAMGAADGVWHESARTSRLNTARPISYAIHRTERPVFDSDESALVTVLQDRAVLFVVDSNVDALYGLAMRQYACRRLNARGTVVVSPLETDKAWPQVEHICGTAAEMGLDRHGIIVGVGGGVTLDMAGMAAAVFRRGVGYVRVATTLVGLVDVSLGVKQAINACGRKNLIGAFHAPTACVNDYHFLRTLAPRDISCGLAEVAKIALVRDAGLVDDLERHGATLASHPDSGAGSVARGLWYRAECLMLEELCPNLYERELARLVDFGHTFSPTVEASVGYRIPHGEAVALDMLLSVAIGVRQGVCSPALFERVVRLLTALRLPIWHPELPSAERLLGALDHARQHRGGQLNLVVPTTAGRATFVQKVSEADLECAVIAMRAAAPCTHNAVPTTGAA